MEIVRLVVKVRQARVSISDTEAMHSCLADWSDSTDVSLALPSGRGRIFVGRCNRWVFDLGANVERIRNVLLPRSY